MVNRFSKAQVVCILFILWTLWLVSMHVNVKTNVRSLFCKNCLPGRSLSHSGPRPLCWHWYACAAGEVKLLIQAASVESFLKAFTFSTKFCPRLNSSPEHPSYSLNTGDFQESGPALFQASRCAKKHQPGLQTTTLNTFGLSGYTGSSPLGSPGRDWRKIALQRMIQNIRDPGWVTLNERGSLRISLKLDDVEG